MTTDNTGNNTTATTTATTAPRPRARVLVTFIQREAGWSNILQVQMDAEHQSIFDPADEPAYAGYTLALYPLQLAEGQDTPFRFESEEGEIPDDDRLLEVAKSTIEESAECLICGAHARDNCGHPGAACYGGPTALVVEWLEPRATTTATTTEVSNG